jgi:hypothetical protein
MQPLIDVWRLELDRSGFCYDALGHVQTQCEHRLRNRLDQSESERIAGFVIARICFSAQEKLEADPTTDFNRRLEAALCPALERAIESLDSGDSVQQVAMTSTLIAAFLNAP